MGHICVIGVLFMYLIEIRIFVKCTIIIYLLFSTPIEYESIYIKLYYII